MVKQQFKKGIAMVELIFALVIMGIALMSAPMLIQQSIASSNVALQQEAIAALASGTGILLSKHWDEGDTTNAAGVAPIITLTNPIAAASPFNFAGMPQIATGRTITVSNKEVNATAIGQENGNTDFNDIDDYNGHDINLTLFNGENAVAGVLGDYVDLDINITTRITFADDRLPLGNNFGPVVIAGNNIFNTQELLANESNIKFVEATLRTNSPAIELQKNIVLRAFSCNLGTYTLGKEQY